MKEENENNQPGNESGNFGLPEGYFQKSAGSIFNRIEWQEEHKEFPKLSELKSTNAFIIPPGYFSKNECALELIQYPFLNAIQHKDVFRVPENYFVNLEVLELAKVLNEPENELSGFKKLGGLKRENGFIVPSGYFKEDENHLVQILEPRKAKVISLFSKRTAYAMASMLLIATGIWIYTLYSAPAPLQDCGTIACLDKQDLVKVKNLEVMDDEELYELVDPSALEKKLESKGLKPAGPDNKNDSSLNEISAEELLDNI